MKNRIGSENDCRNAQAKHEIHGDSMSQQKEWLSAGTESSSSSSCSEEYSSFDEEQNIRFQSSKTSKTSKNKTRKKKKKDYTPVNGCINRSSVDLLSLIDRDLNSFQRKYHQLISFSKNFNEFVHHACKKEQFFEIYHIFLLIDR